MAVTTSPRLGITRWSAGTDPFGRTQLDGDHATLDAKVAIYGQGTLASRPAPGVAGRFYWATDGAASTTLTYDNGTAWGSHPHAIADLPVAASGSSSATQLVRADDSRLSNARTPTAHTHAAADINSGTLDIARLPVATSGTSSATQVVRADDSRLSNSRTPTAHTHGVTDLTATGTRDATTALFGDNTWKRPGDVTRVVYTTAVPARPAGATYVEWVGQVDPSANAVNGDTWVQTA